MATPAIQAGQTADITVVNPNLEWRYDSAVAFSKSVNTPFQGYKFSTRVVLTIAHGNIAFKIESFTASQAKKKNSEQTAKDAPQTSFVH